VTVPLAIDARALRKQFGDTTALESVTFAVPQGSVFGFLGPNGAGKTTTIRILTGLARPTGGAARVLGRDLGALGEDARREIGFLPDVPAFYHWMTAGDFLHLAGRLFGLAGRELRERIDTLLDLAGLTGVTTRIGGFSRGMKQRLGVAQALVNAPSLLLLDEPTSALDPIGRREVLDMIASLRGRTTVFFSTHILADVERVCDTAAILDRGRVVASAPVAELKRRAAAERITIEVEGDAAALAERLTGAPWLSGTQLEGSRLRLTVSDVAQAQRSIPEAIAALGLGLRRLETGEVSLEDVFVRLIGEGSR